MAEFAWTKQTEQAAQLIASGDFTYPEIAERLGVVRETLWHWRQRPEFVARVKEHIEAQREAIMSFGIAQKHNRVQAQNERWLSMRRLQKARANDINMEGVPGGDTGQIVAIPKSVRVIGGTQGERETTYEYKFDATLSRAILDVEMAARDETEQQETDKETKAIPQSLEQLIDYAYGEKPREDGSGGEDGWGDA